MGPSGPAGNGSNGSSTPPPVLPPIVPINLGTQPPPFDPPHFTLPPPGGANNILDIFVPTPETLPPPVPPSMTISPTINTSTGLTTTIASGGLTKANTLTIMGTVTGDDLSSVSVHVLDQFNGTTTDLGAATIDPSGNWSLQTPQLGDGSHTFTAEAFSNASTPAFAGPVTATVDTVPPTVTISTNDSSLKIGDVAHLTFTLSEADANFSVNDIVVTGGTLSNFAGSGTSFTADFTPLSKSTTPATVDVAGATFTDAAGNDNLASPPLIMTVNTVSAATWSISGDTSVTEGNAANYTVHLAGTLQAGQTATIHLAVADITTTSADYASFVAAVNTAITGRADLSFDANTGTLTYTGDGSNPMADLVIHLGAVNDSLVEGPEQYQVVLSTPGTTTVSDITLGTSEVTTTIIDINAATWSISGDASVTEGTAANYTVHLAGTLAANETATIHLAIANITTTSADYANFVAAVNTAITGRTDLSFDANSGTLTYTGTGSPMADLVIHLGAVNDGLVEGPEQYSVSLSNPGSTSGANVAGTGSVTTTIIDTNAATWSISGDASVTEGTAANYTVHLAGTLAANETATIHLAIANITTTSADYANFVAAVNTAITGRTDLSFDANSGTLTHTGTGSPMADLVIHLGTVNDSLVEGPEQYSVSLSNPGSTSGANVAGTGSVTTTIIDTNAATWSISGDASVTEGNVANYTVHLAGTLAANETATTHLAIANITTTSADYANFVAAVNTAITGRTDLSFDANSGTLTYTGTGSPMADLVIHLGTVNDSQLEGNEQYSVSLSNPGSTTGADVVGTASVITTIIDNDPTAGTPITLQVDEAALSTGSNPSLTTETANGPLSFTAAGFNLVSFAFSTDISGLTTDLNNDGTQDIFWVRDSGTQISGYLDAAHTELADRLTLSAPPGGIAAGATGSVTVTETLSAALKNPNDNGAQVSSLGHVGVVATDTNGDTATGTVNPFDKDDVPTASPASNSGQAVSPDTNLLITLDLSGSMGDPSGVGGLTKLQLAEQAILNLMQQYDTLGHVKVELVTFSDTARNASGGWVDLSDPAAKANLINIILGLSAGGNTNYAAALTARHG